MERFQEIQDEKLRALGNTLTTMWNNQVELSKSETRLDEQFCVLARLSIRTLNEILIRIGSEELVTEKVIETAFKEWESFRGRSDYKNFMLEWFLGKPMSELPPPPAKKEETPASPGPKAEGPQEFGGDYGAQQKSDERNTAASEEQQSNDRPSEKDAVSTRQDVDRPAS